MAKQTVNLALAVTAIVFSIGTLLFTLGGSSDSAPDSGLGFDVRQMEERLALLEIQLDKVKKQPPRTAQAKRTAADNEGDKAPGQDQEKETPEDQSASPGTNEEGLATRVSALQTRIEALESDPIQRGFRYLDSDSVKLRAEGVKALEELARSDPEALAAIQDLSLIHI